jgi:UDP-glucose 4-epimerase
VRAWVTGASGFLGSTLVERLLARGDEVIALVRPASKHRVARGARIVEGVLPSIGQLSTLPPPDFVFHCAAVIDRSEPEGHSVHVEGTVRLAHAARGARFVHVSTTDVLPISSRTPLSEASRCEPRDAYGRTKLEGERRLLAMRPDAVVLRPPGIYGPRSPRDIVLHIAERIERRRFFHLGDGRAVRSWIFVETLVDAMIHAAQRTDIAGVFHVDDGRSVSRHEIAAEIAAALGRSADFAHMPAPIARATGWALERLAKPFNVRPPLTRETVRYATTSQPLDTTRWRSTGFVPRFNLRESIVATLEWGRTSGRLQSGPVA